MPAGETVVFLGPSLTRREAESMACFDFRPPAAQGDLASAAVEGAKTIALIDGAFGYVPSVWHKELLWALDRGISVHGAASMGALRAAELHSFGMAGHGRIFADFASGRLTDDDEVAVVHSPADLGFAPLSEAMVDVRATVAAAREAGAANGAFLDEVIDCAKLLHFSERTYPAIFERLAGVCRNRAELIELREWVDENKRSQKREDAIELLTRLAEGSRPGDFGRTHDRHIATVHWTKAFGRSPDGQIHAAVDKFILDEIRIRPEIFAKLEANAAPRVRSRLNSEMTARGLPLRAVEDVRRQCRNALDWTILEIAREQGIAARFEVPAASKMSILREAGPVRSRRGSASLGADELRWRWLAKNERGLAAMGLNRLLAQNAALVLGFDSLPHLDAALALEREFRLEAHRGGCNMTSTDTYRDPRKPPRWAVWLYMASENDPTDPSIDFESAAQDNIAQVKLTMPFRRSEYFVATDRRQGPTFLHLFGSTVEDIGPQIKKGVGQNFSRPEAVGEFFSQTVNRKNEVADKRMLVLWGHGRGMRFLSQPEDPEVPYSKPGVDNVVDLVGMLKKFPRFQTIGLDCCFMAHLETMYEMRDLADQIIAGPSAIPALSWPYDNVATLLEDRFATSEDDQAVAQSIAVAARESFIETGNRESPVLAFKTHELPAAIEALNKLGDYLADLVVDSSIDGPVQSMARRARRAARGHFNAPDYAELESFANALDQRAALSDDLTANQKDNIHDLVVSVINAARASLVQAAPVRGGNSPHSVTIWFPLQLSLYLDSRPLYESLQSSQPQGGAGQIGGWARFLRKYHGEPVDR